MRADDQRTFLSDGHIDRYRALVNARASVKANEAVTQLAAVGVVHCQLSRVVPDHLAVVYLRRVCNVERAIEPEARKRSVPAWQVAWTNFLCAYDVCE